MLLFETEIICFEFTEKSLSFIKKHERQAYHENLQVKKKDKVRINYTFVNFRIIYHIYSNIRPLYNKCPSHFLWEKGGQMPPKMALGHWNVCIFAHILSQECHF